MKRLAVSLQDLACRDNLLLATWKAARGKQHRPAVARWLGDLDHSLTQLARSILDESAPRGRLRRFAILDPKPREISVHDFSDRVLHHAILNLTEARFERMLVPTSYACRPELGVHAAVRHVQHQLQRSAWWVQVDVTAYFAHIDHALLLDLLGRRFKGTGFLALLERIVLQGAEPGAGRGLPIGALTSQHFANAYLDAADRWLLAHPEVRGHVRYMDDIVWWCDSAAIGRVLRAEFENELRQTRRLRLKPALRSGSSARGLAFCGFRVRPGLVRPSTRKLARYRSGAAALKAFEQDRTDDGCGRACPIHDADRAIVAMPHSAQPQRLLQRAHDGLAATLAHTQSLDFRRRVWSALESTP